MNDGWGIQIASDVIRDGLGVELLDVDNRVCAEVLRCDADHTLTFTTYSPVPLAVVEWLTVEARKILEQFEDGTPLPPRTTDGVRE